MAQKVVPTGDEFPDYDGKVYIQDDSLESDEDIEKVNEVVQDDVVYLQTDDSYDGPRTTGYHQVVPLSENVIRGSELEVPLKDGESANARRVRLWRERNRDKWLKKNREYVADARKKSKTRKYHLKQEDDK